MAGVIPPKERDHSALYARVAALEKRLSDAPIALMDTRTALGVCALREEDFPALYALQGKRVRLVVVDDAEEAP
jgi:hypothetical protein